MSPDTSQCMDNFKVDITGRGSHFLAKAIDIAMRDHKAIGYCIHAVVGFGSLDPGGVLVILSYSQPPSTPLPFRADAATMIPFVQAWLSQVSYPHEPDHDGDNEKGWRVWTDDVKWPGSIFAVEPVWAMLGK